MTVAHYTKILKQLENKPVKKAKFLKHSAVKDRSCGRVKKSCQRCGRTRSIVGQYGINMCRQCFRENATKMGFKQLS